MFFFILLHLSSGCSYTFDFTPCSNNTRGALVTPIHCFSLLPFYIQNLSCSFDCPAGTQINYDKDSHTLQCSKCSPGTFSIGGGELIDSWNSNKNFFSYCWVVQTFGWELNTHCTPWESREGSYLVSGKSSEVQWYSTSAVFYTEIVKKGALRVVYRKQTEAQSELGSGEFMVMVNGRAEYMDTTFGTLQWRTVSIPLDVGAKEVEIVFTAYQTDALNEVQIKEVEFRGTKFASEKCEICTFGTSDKGAEKCEFCEIGTFLEDGQCVPCPLGTSSVEGSEGVESCRVLNTCGPDDYHFEFSDCVSGQQMKIYEWNFPLMCSTAGVHLPKNELVPCSNCPVGMVFKSSKCEYCPEGFYTDPEDLNDCRVCPPGHYAPKTLVHESFDTLPADLIFTCLTSSNAECSNSWEARGSYLSSSSHYKPGWIASLEKKLKSSHDSAYVIINFESKGSSTVFNVSLNGEVVKSFIGEVSGSQFVNIDKGVSTLQALCIHSSHESEECRITKIVFFGGDEGGAQSCVSCPLGSVSNGQQSECIWCLSGQTSDPLNAFCVDCPDFTFAAVPGACVRCPTPSIPSTDHSSCVLPEEFSLENKSFMVSKLAGKEGEASEYCQELRLERYCHNTFLGPVQQGMNFFYLSVANPSVPSLRPFESETHSPAYAFAVLDKQDSLLKDTLIKPNDVCSLNNSKIIVSIGSELSDVKVSENGFNLTYVGGNVCSQNEKFSTEIQFVCNKQEKEGWPVYLGTEKCRFRFLWPTVHACSRCQYWEVEYKKGSCNDDVRTVHAFSGLNCVLDENLGVQNYEEPCKSSVAFSDGMVIVSGVISVGMILIIVTMCVMTVKTKIRYQHLALLERSGSLSEDMSPVSIQNVRKEVVGFQQPISSDG